MSVGEQVVRAVSNGVALSCLAQPRASRNKVVGLQGSELKIALTSPPVDGKANKALCEFFAELFAVAKGRVRVKSGESSRHKVIEISGTSPEEAIMIIDRIFENE